MSNDVNIEVSVWLKDTAKLPENTQSMKNVVFGFKPVGTLAEKVLLDNNGNMDIRGLKDKFDINFILKTTKLCDQTGNKCSDYTATFKPVVVSPPNLTSAKQLMWVAPGQLPPDGAWSAQNGFTSFKHNVGSGDPSLTVTVDRSVLQQDFYSYSLAILVSKESNGFPSKLVRDDPQIKNGTSLNVSYSEIMAAVAGLIVGILGTLLLKWWATRGKQC